MGNKHGAVTSHLTECFESVGSHVFQEKCGLVQLIYFSSAARLFVLPEHDICHDDLQIPIERRDKQRSLLWIHRDFFKKKKKSFTLRSCKTENTFLFHRTRQTLYLQIPPNVHIKQKICMN